MCPGEVLARNRMFLFVTSLVQHFRVVATDGEDTPVHDPRRYAPGLVQHTNDFKVIFAQRTT